MIDTIFSLKEVCESLFGAVIDISADKISTTDGTLLKKFENLIKNSFHNLATKLQKDSGCLNPVRPNEGQNVEKEKYMIVINEKGDDAQKFNQQSWSAVVKNTVCGELKSVSVEKSLLSKEGNRFSLNEMTSKSIVTRTSSFIFSLEQSITEDDKAITVCIRIFFLATFSKSYEAKKLFYPW